MANRPRPSVTLYTTALFLTAAGLAIASGQVEGVALRSGWAALGGFLALLTAAEYLTVRHYQRGEVDAHNLFEAVLAPAILALPGAFLIPAVVIAQGVVSLVRRNQRIKALFNMAQWGVAAGAGDLTYGLLHRGRSLTPTNMVALLGAVAVVSVVNQLAFSFVLRLVQGVDVRTALTSRARAIATGWAINVSFGMLFVIAYAWHAWSTVLFFVPLVILDWASRGIAAVRVDRARLDGLQQATHALGLPIDPREAVRPFLEEVLACFETACVEFVLVSPSGAETHRVTEDGYQLVTGPHPLGAALLHAGKAVRLDSRDGDSALVAVLREAGWRDCAAAPVRSGRRVIGTLCTYDRSGAEGFEHSELTVLEAMATELGGALHKAELLATILEERRKLTDIVDNTSDGICTIDPSGVVESWNAAMGAITGYGAAEMVGTKHFAVLRARNSDGDDVLFELWAQEGMELPTVVQVRTASGDTRWLSCSYTRVPPSEERAPLLVVVGRDITQSHELDRLKEEFVAIVSHELRTPLTPIKGFATSLLEMGDRMDDATRRTSVEAILRSAQRLERLILNLLEASRIESRLIDVRDSEVDITTVAAGVVSEFKEAWSDQQIVLEQRGEISGALGSELWIEQVLSNLLSNALKYASGGDGIQVRLEQIGSTVEMAVIDHGEGIPDEAAERIFQRFERLDQTTRQAGTGLGLYIARELAHAMNGTLTVAPTPGGGATFTLRLPAARVTPVISLV